jgi:alpha-mannosidase
VPSQVLAAEEVGRDRPALYNGQRSVAEIVFVARDVPGCGYRTYYLEALPAPAGLAGTTQTEPVRNSLSLEVGDYRIAVTEGRVTSLVARRSGRELIGDGVAGPAGTGAHRFGEVVVLEDLLVDLEDGPIEQVRKVPGVASASPEARPGAQPANFTGRAWTSAAHPARVACIERGPVLTRLVLAGQVLDCPVVQEIVLYEHIARLEISLRLDWHGQKNTLVRAAYPLAVPDAVTTYETPYGSVVFGRDELPNTYRGEGTRFVQKWIDLSTAPPSAAGGDGGAGAGDGRGAWGVTWSSKVCAHTLHADERGRGTGLSPLLVRSAYSCGTPFLWYTLEGRHEFAFALQAHEGTWRDSHSWRLGWEFHQPLVAARLTTARPLAPLPGRDTLPQALSLCTLEGDHATVGTIHQPEAETPPGTYAVRLVEVEGRGGAATLTFCRPVRRAARTSLVADDPQPLPVDGARVTVDLGAFEIATVQVELERDGG